MSKVCITNNSLASRPTHEFIITCVRIKRTQDLICRAVLFEGLWGDQESPLDSDQKEIVEYSQTVGINSYNHEELCLKISKFIFDQVKVGGLNHIRFSSAKYLDQNMKPKYENMLEGSLGSMQESEAMGIIFQLVSKMLSYSKPLKPLLSQQQREIANEDQVRTIQSQQIGCRDLPIKV